MKNILFDLDGTIVDTSEGIIKSIKSTIVNMRLDELPEESIKSFIGPPLRDAFINFYGMSVDDAYRAVSIFRAYYDKGNKLICKSYKGIAEMLEGLKNDGYQLFIATSKPTKYAIEILQHLNIYNCFRDIVGSNLDNTRSKKCEVIQYILDNYNLNHSETVMVGDKAQDLIGAEQCGISAIGVTYGFGSLEELEEQKSIAIVDSPGSLDNIIRGV